MDHGTLTGLFKGKRLLAVVPAMYLLSLFVQVSIREPQLSGLPHLARWNVAAAPPLVLSGDSPHYLILVNSIIEDFDVYTGNNYDAAQAGGWQAGARFKGVALDRHSEIDRTGKELSYHSIFLPLLLSIAAWPFAGTAWVEPVCIAVTALVVLFALMVFARRSGLPEHWTVVLALATPLWCYSRDIWTEPWLTAIWIGLLFAQSLPLVFALGLVGTLIKYNFVIVPVVMAFALWLKGERRRSYVLAASGVIGILIAIATVQYLFRDANHFNLFHLGVHSGADATIRQKIVPLRFQVTGLIGLLVHPEAGILPFFPFLLWGFWQLRKGGEVFLPVLAFYLLIGAYPGWHGGAGFSARYLVPALPALVIAVASAKPRGRLFTAALLYSIFWGMLAGFAPPLAYERTPLGVAEYLLRRLIS